MKARKYTEEHIIAVLKEAEAGVADRCRKYGKSDATYYNWKAKYTGRFSRWNLLYLNNSPNRAEIFFYGITGSTIGAFI